MNKVDDLIKILEFCKEHTKNIIEINDDTFISNESFDDIGVDIILKTFDDKRTKVTIYNNCYEVNGEEFVYSDIMEVLRVMDNILFENNIVIDNVKLDIAQLETIYNFYIQQKFKHNTTINNSMGNDTERKYKCLQEFLCDIEDRQISISIFENLRGLLHYLYVDGQDEQQILDGIENLAVYGFDIEKLDNVLQLGNMYVLCCI